MEKRLRLIKHFAMLWLFGARYYVRKHGWPVSYFWRFESAKLHADCMADFFERPRDIYDHSGQKIYTSENFQN